MPARIPRPPLIAAAALVAAVLSLAPICGSPGERAAVAPTTTVAAPTSAPRPLVTVTPPPASAPEPTPTDEPPPPASPTPAWSSPPVADSEGMVFSGSVWVDARPWNGDVLAFVGGQECGFGRSINLIDGGPFFTMGVKSAAAQPGCGTPGAMVSFSVNGRLATTTVEWSPGIRPSVNIVVGPAPAWFRGIVLITAIPATFQVVAYVNGVSCGTGAVQLLQLTAENPPSDVTYGLTVIPDELQAGCARDGDDIEFHAEYHTDGIDVDEVVVRGVWHPLTDTELAPFEIPTSIPTRPFPTPSAYER